MKNRLEKWSKRLYLQLHTGRFPSVYVGIVMVVTALLIPVLFQLKFNYNIENLFSNDDPEVVVYQQFKADFGNENNVLLIGIQSPLGIFEMDFLTEIESLTRELKALNGVSKVISPTNAKDYVLAPVSGMVSIPLIHLRDSTRMKSDENKIYTSKKWVGSLFSKDKQRVSILLGLGEDLLHQQNENLLVQIKTLLSHHDFVGTHLAGRIHTQHYYIQTMKKEMGLFAGLSLLLFCGSIYLVFRNVRFITIPMVVIVVALIWLFGAMSLMNIQLEIMITMLPTLVIVLGTSVSIHYLSKYQWFLSEGCDGKSAVRKAFEITTVPNLLIASTTAVGFASLYFIPIHSIQLFGLLAALGMMLVLGLGLILIPFLLNLACEQDLKPKANKAFFVTLPSLIFGLVVRHRLAMILAFIVLVGGSLFGIVQIKINNFFLDDLDPKSQLKSDLVFFENHFSGIRPFELVVSHKNGSLLSHQSMLKMEKLTTYLQDNYSLGMEQSPVMAMKSLNQARHGNDGAHYIIPKQEKAYQRLLKLSAKYHVLERLHVIDKAQKSIRISGRIPDLGSAIYHEKSDALKIMIASLDFDGDIQMTGAAYLMDKANTNITKNFMLGILLATIIITLMISTFTTSLKVTVVALVVNAIPLIFIGGVMGMFDITLKVSTALLFTIVLGIAVDDTIHFLHTYLNFKKKHDVVTSVKSTLVEMTRPILYTTTVLFVGFLIFGLSSFTGIKMLGLLTGAALLIAMLTDLLLLPILIIWFDDSAVLAADKEVPIKDEERQNVGHAPLHAHHSI